MSLPRFEMIAIMSSRLRSVMMLRFTFVAFIAAIFMASTAFAQTGRPISGVIAATDKPIAISYTNEAGEVIGRIAGVGEPIYLNDEISTPAGASLQVLLRDQTVFSIGPNSTLVFDEFIFDPTNAGDLALTASVKKGTFKFISGKISKLKPGAMTLKLPNATASVRGTSVLGRVDESGASDIVLLTGAVQLETRDAPAVDLFQPGWGVSIAETGAASDPAPFAPEEIDIIIKEVELSEEEAEPQEGASDVAAEEEPSEEAVESVAEVVREAGEDVSETEIVEILQKAEGDPQAVAEGIVKVIIEKRIESGEIDAQALAEFEAFANAQGENGDGATLFGSEDFNVEDLNVADLKVEDLGIEGVDFGGEASFVDAFSSRLDVETLALPKFDEGQFGFDSAQFEEVTFDVASFNRAEIAVTQKFDIKDVSQLIVGDQFESGDTPEIELSFFDILFNAETINKEVARREVSFGFDGAQPNLDDKPQQPQQPQEVQADQELQPRFSDGGDATENTAAPDAPAFVPTLIFKTQTDENGVAKTVIERPVFEPTKDEQAPVGAEQQAPTFEKADVVLTQLVQREPVVEVRQPIAEVPYEEQGADEKASQEAFANFLEQVRKEALLGEIDPLEYYKAGKTGAQWLTLQSDGSLGNSAGVVANYDNLISESYAGSAQFRDELRVVDTQTGFTLNAKYAVVIDYGSASATGSLALSNMTLSGQAYYGASGSTSHTESFSNVSLQGRDSADGTFAVGDEARDVNIVAVDFHDSTNASNITSRITTELDMSIGSTVAINAALDGTLAEFRISSEERACNPNCTGTPGGVGGATSIVAAE